MPDEIADDESRQCQGVLVTLVDLGDGQSLIIMDDVSNQGAARNSGWHSVALYTKMAYPNAALNEMALTDDQYRDIGVTLVARLLARSGRGKAT